MHFAIFGLLPHLASLHVHLFFKLTAIPPCFAACPLLLFLFVSWGLWLFNYLASLRGFELVWFSLLLSAAVLCPPLLLCPPLWILLSLMRVNIRAVWLKYSRVCVSWSVHSFRFYFGVFCSALFLRARIMCFSILTWLSPFFWGGISIHLGELHRHKLAWEANLEFQPRTMAKQSSTLPFVQRLPAKRKHHQSLKAARPLVF